jgi:hypothetical protein
MGVRVNILMGVSTNHPSDTNRYISPVHYNAFELSSAKKQSLPEAEEAVAVAVAGSAPAQKTTDSTSAAGKRKKVGKREKGAKRAKNAKRR